MLMGGLALLEACLGRDVKRAHLALQRGAVLLGSSNVCLRCKRARRNRSIVARGGTCNVGSGSGG